MSKKINQEKSTKKEDMFMSNFNQGQGNIKMMEKIGNSEENQFYKGETFKMLEEIENTKILMKIYTVVKTHLKILKEKEWEN